MVIDSVLGMMAKQMNFGDELDRYGGGLDWGGI